MSFLYPAFLAGIAAIAIPIVLHLRRRDVAPEVPFTAVRLLHGSPVERPRRRTLRDLLLLVARVTALVLLAFAFARPYLAGAAPASPLVIVAVDRSYSMGAPGQFERARELAADATRRAVTGARIALLAFDDAAEVVAWPGAAAEALTALEALQPGFGGTRFGPVLSRARELAGDGGGRLIVVTDLQRAGWSDQEPSSVPGNLVVELRSVPPVPENLALIELRAGAGGMLATVANPGASPAKSTIHLSVEDRQLAPKTVSIDAGSATTVTVSGAPAAGVVTASVEDPAGFPADDRRFLLLAPDQRPRVLIVAGGAASGYYVARALGAAPKEHGFDVVERQARSISERGESMQGYSAAVLLATRGLTRPAREALAAFVRNGGGLLVAASDEVEPAVLGATFGWEGFEAAAQRTPPGSLSPVDVRHPVFRPFGPLIANLALARVRSAWHLSGGGWEVLARFGNGSPALLERRVGQGRVVLFASDFDRQWNDLPLTPAFVPLALQLMAHVAPGTRLPHSLTIGDLPRGVPAEPGVHEFDGRRVAVNVDVRERTTEVLTEDEFRAMVKVGEAPAGAAAHAASDLEDRQGLWRFALMFMLAALVAESVVGRAS